jgi:Sec-independent protein translocase protein TatA
MTISLGQIIIIALLGLILFGNFPNVIRSVIKGIKTLLGKTNKNIEDNTSTKIKKEQEKRDSNP